MTISYNLDVSSVSSFTFFKLLLRWRGSIWKSIKSELLIWIISYYIVFCIYRFALNPHQQRQFEVIAEYCNGKLSYIPLTFMLAFFVNAIADRWRQMFSNMGWIENVALSLVSVLKSTTDREEATLMRRSIIRYMILSQILVYRDISMRVRRRFPNYGAIVTAGFMMEHELKTLESIRVSPFKRYWVPVNWALTILARARAKKYVADSPSYNMMIKEILSFRTNLAWLCNYDWVPIPIAYPQVVFLAVRSYFLICLVSRQFLIRNSVSHHAKIDVYIPFMTILQFFFFVAWMKVAEALLNPLGEDDDDFECNFLIDRNITTGMAIVDQTADLCPEMTMDNLYDPELQKLSGDEYDGNEHALVGSVSGIELPEETSSALRSYNSSRRSPGRLSRSSSAHRSGRAKGNSLAIPMELSVPELLNDRNEDLPDMRHKANSSYLKLPPSIPSTPPIHEEDKDQDDDEDGFTVIKL